MTSASVTNRSTIGETGLSLGTVGNSRWGNSPGHMEIPEMCALLYNRSECPESRVRRHFLCITIIKGGPWWLIPTALCEPMNQ